MTKVYDIRGFSVSAGKISFTLNRELIAVPIDQCGSRLLPKATAYELGVFEIDLDGIGVHWPLLDEDLSISGLLRSGGREDLVANHIESIDVEDVVHEVAS